MQILKYVSSRYTVEKWSFPGPIRKAGLSLINGPPEFHYCASPRLPSILEAWPTPTQDMQPKSIPLPYLQSLWTWWSCMAVFSRNYVHYRPGPIRFFVSSDQTTVMKSSTVQRSYFQAKSNLNLRRFKERSFPLPYRLSVSFAHSANGFWIYRLLTGFS